VSDIRMPGMSGLALQQELLERQSVHPIIFISGHGDIPMAVDAVKNGALNFLTKPFRDQDLLDCIDEAIAKNAVARQQTMRHSQLERRLNELTRRESQVLDGVVAGLSNKEIAEQLHVSPRTVEVHRGHMMEKMGARSLTELLKSMGKI
ncbi:MAG: response regulator transcription factor, partial [Spongiibacteraceae bacterium]